MFFEKLENIKTAAIVCDQFGDTGKGKFVDVLAPYFDIIFRGTGGPNAGHTIKINSKTYIFHLIPSGILHDSDGKINVIGSGVAFDPKIVKNELGILEGHNKSFDNLMIAYNSKLILPHHILLDNLASKKKIGTTGKGIGPVYGDYIERRRLITNDFLNVDVFHKKLVDVLDYSLRIIKSYNPDDVKMIMSSSALGNGIYYSDSDSVFSIDAIIENYKEMGVYFKEMIRDTDSFAKENVGKKRILLEGAQGLLLSSDYGASPFITCSDSSIHGLAKGSGLNREDVDWVLGIAKFYMTRVGEGPFPTELGGSFSDEWCNRIANKVMEEEKYSDASINDTQEFVKGVAIRRVGGEYGATTGRPRRTGWLDLPLLRYAIGINGPDLIFTKSDVLSGIDEVKVCTGYEYVGEDYIFGNVTLKNGDIINNHIPLSEIMSKCKPVYSVFPGWSEDISQVKNYNSLPNNFRNIMDFVEKETGGSVKIVSVGPDRNETIFK